ncbi:MAG: GNAT family N-acetyltransferase [Bacteroidales bacterium]|jgi:N-acetylglutamate synthase-like GNAT family acetyltransferase|nr:GNAT family N-acetyltransferase [Bacteroidales bacterium]
MSNEAISIFPAQSEHEHYAQAISDLILEASKDSDSGLALRSPEYILKKMREGKTVIALAKNGDIAGFVYIDTWQNGAFVATSGLIVNPQYRGVGLATLLKKEAFALAAKLFPLAKNFGLTTSDAVKKINKQLGYKEVSYTEITTDDGFWKGCESCTNFAILEKNKRTTCLCTAMIFDPKENL